MKECPNCGRRHMCVSLAAPTKQTAWDQTAVENIITDNLALDWEGRDTAQETRNSVRRTAAAIVAAFISTPPKG